MRMRLSILLALFLATLSLTACEKPEQREARYLKRGNERAAAYGTMPMTVNEKRRKENLPDLEFPEADTVWMPSGTIPLGYGEPTTVQPGSDTGGPGPAVEPGGGSAGELGTGETEDPDDEDLDPDDE